MESKRDTVFDIVRSFCVLEIVAFWHLLDYASKSPVSDNFRHGAGTVLTISVLTVFTFMSGHFLKKYSIGSMKDVLSF